MKAPGDGAMKRCAKCGDHGEIHHGVCADCWLNHYSTQPHDGTRDEERHHGATDPPPVSAAVPHTSSLVPSSTGGERAASSTPAAPPSSTEAPSSTEPEVEHLLRMYRDGRLEPARVDLPPVPDELPESCHRVAEFYALVRGVRLWAGDDRPVPLACGWAAEKLGLGKITVWRARRTLVAAGVLAEGDPLPARGKRATETFEPGRGGDVVPLRRAS